MGPDPKNKTIFAGRIEIGPGTNVYHTPWADLIKAAKASLACWNVDTQAIWDQFVAFNRARGNTAVPAGFLLGFMRRWQKSRGVAGHPQKEAAPVRDIGPTEKELLRLIAVASIRNREFHASDLRRVIGNGAYNDRVLDVVRQFGCPMFTASLAVHGRAVLAGEILQ
jgi:hypothetical protein